MADVEYTLSKNEIADLLTAFHILNLVYQDPEAGPLVRRRLMQRQFPKVRLPRKRKSRKTS